MKIQLLGTGGAAGIPGFYSDSRVSKYARQHKGKDIRSRAAACVDDVLKIDLGPDTWSQLALQGLDARDWTAVLFTHSDADHFAPDELMYCFYPFNEELRSRFTVYANSFICQRIRDKFEEWPFDLEETQSFSPFHHGGYRITPIRAHHKLDEDAHNLIIEDGKSSVLYATDTGIWDAPTWDYLAGVRVDCLVLECTEAFAATDYDGHLDANEFREVLARLQKMGTIDSSSQVVTTHHSDLGNATHHELEAFFNPLGVTVGHDGMILKF